MNAWRLLLLLLASLARARDDVDGSQLPAPPPNGNPCRNSTFGALPFCDPASTVDVRVADLLRRLTLAEKITQLTTGNGVNGGTSDNALPRLGIPAFDWWSEGTHGVKGAYNAGPHTNFALPISTAMSFNRSLWSKTAQQIAREARSWYNAGNLGRGLTYWTPVINLARDPRWGRNLECPGEDPVLSSAYAEAFVRGFQEAPEAPGTLLAGATCKHFVANSMERSSDDGITFGREDFDAAVSPRDLVDSYLAPFQACVEKGNAAGLMCSYNSVNGFPTCAWPWLLNTTARGQWGFDGV